MFDHVAIIMDGNGRWAKKRLRPRVWGHIRGSAIVSEIVEKADDLKIKKLTLYAFSSENWSRPKIEILTLFKLLKKFIQKETKRIVRNNIKFEVIGDCSGLPNETIDLIRNLEMKTKDSKGLILNFAFGYGSRQEIVNNMNEYLNVNHKTQIDYLEFQEYVKRKSIYDVDLLIRTGGEYRISNFLLWEIAYSELAFSSTYWPDFSAKEFEEIINDCKKRERRFGQISSSKFEETGRISSIQKRAFESKKSEVSKL